MDTTQFENDVQRVPWQNIFHMDNVNDKVQFLCWNMLHLVNNYTSVRTIKVTKRNEPWITTTIKIAMNLRNKALKKFKTTKLHTDWSYYKSLRNQVNFMVKQEKAAFFKHKINSNNKQLWKELKQLLSPNSVQPDLPAHLDNPEAINTFFVNSIPNSNDQNVTQLINFYKNNKIIHNQSFKFSTVETSHVAKIISGIKSTAYGSDGININILRLFCPIIEPYLTHVINMVLLTSIYPEAWKKAVITPLPKTPRPNEFKDLRPISILPVMSKIIEKIMNDQLRAYVDAKHIIPDHQSGFRPNYSCTTALIDTVDDIITATDSKLISVLALLDYSKAFDTINHGILLSILESIGLSCQAVKLFDSYLTGRCYDEEILNSAASFLWGPALGFGLY
ncbi:uncharacterized protein LOC116163917 [Photinus pyralis]|uniref:uncharacterized protein LOC116163917 n=1 Tax=Photinus pyralis TaxID=7054 RepID=UPI0012672386|nr:uncharacterized protein LOC116163917 [Photinus pyralis]